MIRLLSNLPKVLTVLVVTWFLGGTTQGLAAQKCQSVLPHVPVEISISLGQLNYLKTHNRKQLGKLYSSFQVLKKGWVPAGLTVAGLGYSASLTVQSQKISSRYYCSEISSVNAAIGYENIDVYIAKEYASGTCQYKSILKHERRHVAIFQKALKEFIPDIEKKFRKTINLLNPVITRDTDEALKIIQSRLEKKLKPFLKKIDRILTKRNSAIDTKANYLREQKHCSSW